MIVALRGRLFVALSGIILVQTTTALLWAGAAAERLSHLEKQTDRTEILVERTARLEEQVSHIQLTLQRIERKLDRTQEGLK